MGWNTIWIPIYREWVTLRFGLRRGLKYFSPTLFARVSSFLWEAITSIARICTSTSGSCLPLTLERPFCPDLPFSAFWDSWRKKEIYQLRYAAYRMQVKPYARLRSLKIKMLIPTLSGFEILNEIVLKIQNWLDLKLFVNIFYPLKRFS